MPPELCHVFWIYSDQCLSGHLGAALGLKTDVSYLPDNGLSGAGYATGCNIVIKQGFKGDIDNLGVTPTGEPVVIEARMEDGAAAVCQFNLVTHAFQLALTPFKGGPTIYTQYENGHVVDRHQVYPDQPQPEPLPVSFGHAERAIRQAQLIRRALSVFLLNSIPK